MLVDMFTMLTELQEFFTVAFSLWRESEYSGEDLPIPKLTELIFSIILRTWNRLPTTYEHSAESLESQEESAAARPVGRRDWE